MRVHHRDGPTNYSSERISSDGEPARFRGGYRPRGERFEAASDSLEYFLTERYCLYHEHLCVLRAEIAPPPWALQLADAEIEENTMAGPVGLSSKAGRSSTSRAGRTC